MENKIQKQCEDCKEVFETISKFRSICPNCSARSYEEAGIKASPQDMQFSDRRRS